MILDQLPFAVLVVDEHFQYIFSNENFNSLFGLPHQQQNLTEFIPVQFFKEGELDKILSKLNQGKRSDRIIKIPRFRLRMENQTDRYFNLLVMPLKVNGVFHFMIVFQDYTDEQSAEISSYQHAKLMALGEMAASIAHELNNFLSILQGHIDLADMKNKDEQVGYHLQLMRKQIESISAFAKNILNFSRRDPREFEEVPLNQVVRETTRLLQARMRKNNVIVEINLENGPTEIRGNPVQLQQLIINLLLNSKKAIRGKGTIRITTRAVADQVVLEISDDGIGMSQEIAAQIFNPFFTTRKEGNGLGLNICEKIVQQHNGIINFSTEENKWTTFTITFPKAG